MGARSRPATAAPLALAGAALLMTLASAGAAASPVAAAAPSPCTENRGDFTITTDAGAVRYAALGSPRRPVGSVPGAGAVLLRIPAANRTLTSATLGQPLVAGGAFGAGVVAAPVNSADECNDLVIGFPGRSGGRGGVAVVPGDATGFLTSAAVWLPTAGLGLQPGDRLGSALTAVAVSGGTLVAAGAPGRDVAGASAAGAVVTWFIPSGGSPFAIPAPTSTGMLVQGSGGVEGRAEAGDRFGEVIAARGPYAHDTVTVGIPREDIGNRADAGAVARLTFAGPSLASDQLLWQGHGLPGTPAAGDRLGAAVAAPTQQLQAAGLPGENAGGRADSGAVIVRTDTGTFRRLTQGTPGVPGSSERGDRFGSALAVLFGTRGQEVLSVAVGAPGEDVGSRTNRGAVTHISTGEATSGFTFASQATSGLASGDAFGSRLVAVAGPTDLDEDRVDTLLAGAPGEDTSGHADVGRFWDSRTSGLSLGSLGATGTRTGERLGG